MKDISSVFPNLKYNDKYDCGDDTYMYVAADTDAVRFEELCKEAEEAGFNLVDSNDIESNLSRTYRKDFLLHIYYVPAERKIRIIADGMTGGYSVLPVKSGDAPPVLWQYEVDHSLIDCGMCYIMRCDDGSFFIIDTPHWYSVNDDIRIIEFLKKVSGGEKPRVSGWFFSHAHEDHIGKFNDIVSYYYDRISIETVFYNFPSPSHRDAPWDIPFFNAMCDFRRNLDMHPEIKRVKLHTGMRFAVRNIAFTVLCTHEDIHPNPTQDFNNTSSVITAECAGTSVFFPGDASAYSDGVMIRRYNNALKCDIMQIAHHGHSGTSPGFYRRAGAKCALFPVTQIKFDEELPRQESNRTAIEIADEYYIASNGTVEIPLPYSPHNVRVYPDETFEDFEGIFNLWCYEYTDEYKERLYKEYLKRKVDKNP